MSELNSAAIMKTKGAKLTVEPVTYTKPSANQIVVKNHAVAINPLDWIIQVAGSVVYPFIKYPFVLGADTSGEVVEVGSAVTRFKVGDRVLGHAVGTDKDCNNSAESTFQTFTVLLENMTAAIPDDMSYEAAAVIPLGASTAACGLFQKDFLALEYPTLSPKPQNKVVLIWGGSTSVGCNAIQLAKAAGYEVLTTASPKNFSYLTSLGATQVFDYHSPTVVAEIVSALKHTELAGTLAVGKGSTDACIDIASKSRGNRFVAFTSTPVSFERGVNPKIMAGMVAGMTAMKLKSIAKGVKVKMIFGTTLKKNEVSKIIYEDFLPAALAHGSFMAAPEAQVVGTGLETIQQAMDLQKAGVSARKLVVKL